MKFYVRMRPFVAFLVLVLFSTRTFAQSASDLDRLLASKNYHELELQVPGARLSGVERLYFEGIFADRLNRPAEAIEDLERALPELQKTNAHRAAISTYALANDYFLVGRYPESTKRYSDLLAHYGKEFSHADRQSIRDNRDAFALLGSASPQAISARSSFSVDTHRDIVGDIDVPVNVGEHQEWWVFDTGANVSTISRSTAARLGLTLSNGHARTQSGSTGQEIPLSIAVIPELRFGSAVISNLVVLVIEDKELDIDLGRSGHYAIQGILGYPVLAALGSFTFTKDHLTVNAEIPSVARSVRMYTDDLTPLIVPTYEGQPLPFVLDTGNGGAELTARFDRKYPRLSATLPKEYATAVGVGGVRKLPVYHLPRIQLRFGTAVAEFKNITVINRPRGIAVIDDVFGNLGQQLLGQFRTYTIDFANMQFFVGDEP